MKNCRLCGLRLRHRGVAVLSAMAIMALAVIFHPRMAAAQVPVSITNEAQPQSSRSAAEYWTPDRMRSAVPKDIGVVTTNVTPQRTETSLPADAAPGFAPGWKPGSGPKPEINSAFMMDGVQPQTSPPFTPPVNPTDFANYAPFQRYRFPFKYMIYPYSTIGKLFFTQNGQSFVCSASVIGRGTLATAGHCIHAGSGGAAGWSSNFLFCPSYNAGGANPLQGCWAWVSATVSGSWFTSGSFDRDYGCIVASATGTVHANRVGNITGWTGRAWNWPSRQAIHAFGYAQASPFNGFDIITTTSTEWYEADMTAGGPKSKYIGSDMTGGSSGGPWWLNVAHPTSEIADSDGSNITDPGHAAANTAPFINGINSHKRCLGNCGAGLFTQEIGSPQFMSTVGDLEESEDIFGVCLNHALGNNAGAMSVPSGPVKAPSRVLSRVASEIGRRSRGR